MIVQDPRDALVPSMPASAIAVDAARRRRSRSPSRRGARPARPPATTRSRSDTRAGAPPPDARRARAGPPSGFTCPECSGALWELREGELVRYRCRVGHAYSEEAMVDAQGSAVEAALWAALEVLEERGELLRADRRPDAATAPRTEQRFRDGAREAERARGDRSAACSTRPASRRRRMRAMSDATTRPSRRCSSSSSAPAGSTSPATSARASSAASGAAWTRVGCESFGDYLDYLEVNPGRVRAALRDAADQRHGVLPRPAGLGAPARRGAARRCSRPRPTDEPVRVWSAGCATARRPTRSRWCSPSCSAWRPTASG